MDIKQKIKEFGWLVPILFFIFLLFASVPGWLIDFIIVSLFTVSIVTLLQAMSTKKWSDLSTFPIILIISAIFRLSLNVATTGKILYDGHAGSVIDSVAEFTVKGSIGIGFIIFVIIIILNIAIAIGAKRMSEVNARFVLEQLPTKNMDILQELNSGLLKPEEAKEKKLELQMQSEFYSSMDGAGKYIMSDVIIAIVLFVINISVGFVIGMVQEGLSFAESITRYTMLTVGDGVLNGVSSLMMAIGTGMILGRVYDQKSDNIIKKIVAELTRNSVALFTAGVVSIIMPITAGFSMGAIMPFFIIGVGLIFLGYKIDQNKKKELLLLNEEQEEVQDEQERLNQLKVAGIVEPISLELGYDLAKLVKKQDQESEQNKGKNKIKNANVNEGNLTENIKMIRRNVMYENGVEFPDVHIVDDGSIGRTSYCIKIRDVVVGRGELQLGKLLALRGDMMEGDEELHNGEETIEPVFGTKAYWIPASDANRAALDGWAIEDWMGIVSTHLRQAIITNLHVFIDRQQTQDLIDQVAERYPVIKKEIENEKINLSIVQGVFKNLVKEYIAIKDLPVILESIVDAHHQIQLNLKYVERPMEVNLIDEITQWVRENISKNICEKFKSPVDERIHAIMYDFSVEKTLAKVNRNNGYHLSMDPIYKESMITAMIHVIEDTMLRARTKPIVITSRSDMRIALSRTFLEKKLQISTLSYEEVSKSGFDLNIAKIVGENEINRIREEFEMQNQK